jgi:hypothetical protein
MRIRIHLLPQFGSGSREPNQCRCGLAKTYYLCTKAFGNQDYLLKFGQFPCSWIRIRIPNMDLYSVSRRAKSMRIRIHNTKKRQLLFLFCRNLKPNSGVIKNWPNFLADVTEKDPAWGLQQCFDTFSRA